MNVRILHTNDLHGHLTPERAERLAELRREAELYFDSGDAVRYGNVALPVAPDPVWSLLAGLGVSAQVPGNREFHVVGAAMRRKLRGAEHPIVCANLFDREGKLVFPPSLVVEIKGVRVGIVGAMVAMVTERMAAAKVSAFLNTEPVAAAREEGERLRRHVDALFAITHIGKRRDFELAEGGPFDAIFGGHSHDVIAPQQIGRTWVAQGGSHGRFAGIYAWDGERLSGEIVPLPR